MDQAAPPSASPAARTARWGAAAAGYERNELARPRELRNRAIRGDFPEDLNLPPYRNGRSRIWFHHGSAATRVPRLGGWDPWAHFTATCCRPCYHRKPRQAFWVVAWEGGPVSAQFARLASLLDVPQRHFEFALHLAIAGPLSVPLLAERDVRIPPRPEALITALVRRSSARPRLGFLRRGRASGQDR
jgi:hypothetical protein